MRRAQAPAAAALGAAASIMNERPPGETRAALAVRRTQTPQGNTRDEPHAHTHSHAHTRSHSLAGVGAAFGNGLQETL